jgi:hypothetical protein
VYTEDVAPEILEPFLRHWYAGVVPPLTGVAVKVTEVPEHTAPEGDAAIVTPAGIRSLMLIVMIFDVAGLPLTHDAFEVSTTVIWSPFESADDI